MKPVKMLVNLSLVALLTGCASSSEQAKSRYDKNHDPRVGEEVGQVCHTRSIRGWSNVDNDRDALLVHLNNNRTYKVSLIGACDPDWAMIEIAVITRTGLGCMGTGDRIVTDAQPERRTSCSISRINEWHSDIEENSTPSESDSDDDPD